MSEKHDRGYARTAQDLESKYRFGKTFSEMLGLINDNRDKVDAVESGLRDEIKETSTLLKRDTEQIVMQATETVKTQLSQDIGEVDNSVTELTKQVALKLNASDLSIKVKEEVSKGVSLETGYKFDANGLNISKSGESLKNLLDNTGMYVTNSGDNVLTANKDGVNAKDLHASTYLIIGKGDGRSRFEDYDLNGGKRTACFWIGG
jgi:hypothetical protein